MAQAVNLVINKRQQRVTYYDEALPDGITLRMMQIPGDTFLMGSPETEVDRINWEGPQHEVTVPGFFLGKYAVTQAQWRAVAGLPRVKGRLNPNPSKFKGEDRPVEQVSWHEAEEFCARLSVHTGRRYGLPSEAQWEYACRARTQTPFHFGETITTELANYRGTDDESLGWSGSYGDGPKGEYREETTSVGLFEVANDFGLYDMHGNVWEWCADHWHGNYDQAPMDGSPWLTEDSEAARVRRGGSWIYIPRNCRSASRTYYQPGYRSGNIGFRVSCEPPGSLQ
ncbi:formylglycine-generating enzyme family protein [Leptothoe spongobia]|uniref:Formylglycine-generating enzyme family protein n=1 Tax=Leptothoe spongobia TAU-MAC 1115 TaxID=1967444 RepID=A0A947DDJ1_9CYAN|nr:formylglycine-generating enzyme family protein [Leptothoe spongobia]MBT9314900.1 formylglycine-generating enzyme family protein [Leptothoe spongobia TAU-MAC 1115]